jgi:hypothetical protein
MKTNISEQEFWRCAQIWYERLERLRVASIDSKMGIEYNRRAERLYLIMSERMSKVVDVAIGIATPQPISFQKGGI